jgi:hypothetical protein
MHLQYAWRKCTKYGCKISWEKGVLIERKILKWITGTGLINM